MAVIHISEAEAASDFKAVMDRVRAGDDVRIDSGVDVFSLAWESGAASFSAMPQPRSILEVLRLAEARNSSLTLDSEFGNDVEAGIREHEHETLIDPWESF